MFGLVMLLVFVGYLLVSVLIVRRAISYARTHGKSAKRWGWGAALVMYLLVFWDWLPTIAVHQYYCATESRFWVYKTLDQWKKENPGVMEGLHQTLQSSQKTNYGDIDILDERFVIETHRRQPIFLITTVITERRFVDRKTGEVLAKGVDVGSGVGNMTTGGGLKFWLNQNPCIANDFWKLVKQLGYMRGTK